MARDSRRPNVLSFALILVLVAILGTLGCNTAQQTPAAPPDESAAAAAAILKADADWSAAAKPNAVDAWMTFYSDDAVILPPNEKMASTKEEIRKSISGLLGLPGLSIHWQTTKAEGARSGEMGYSYGTYELTSNDAKGKPMIEQGKYLEVWKKQTDGKWKCAVDMWSPNQPAAAPTAK